MFEEFPKMARLSRDCVITEKIDGTNAQIEIVSGLPECIDVADVIATHDDGFAMLAGSRTRYITPTDDNFGFAKWVKANADALWSLGEGRHYGEWWGQGIQRGYGLTEKRFSLFNVARWSDERDREKYPTDRPACCHVVPVLHQCSFDYVNTYVEDCLNNLRESGSWAARDFMKPEGIVVWHEAARVMFKKTLDKDEQPKGQQTAQLAQA